MQKLAVGDVVGWVQRLVGQQPATAQGIPDLARIACRRSCQPGIAVGQKGSPILGLRRLRDAARLGERRRPLFAGDQKGEVLACEPSSPWQHISG